MPVVSVAQNQLGGEASPYLLLHADDPVDWQPWGDAAFAQARAEDKPVFVSIGYATCHWCHVMHEESFKDPAIAAVLNARFVPVKVDREEHPDVDGVYLRAVEAMTGAGGWPLNVFLTPEREPFFGGTYFPPEPGGGRPGFRDVLDAVHQAWTSERAGVLQTADELTALLAPAPAAADTTLLPDLPARAVQALAVAYDEVHGGFGPAPKFPQAPTLRLLLRQAHAADDSTALRMATGTLRALAASGLHDHVGGGFHRYAVDAAWRVPHFEKMLYDQAQLALASLDAYQVTGDTAFAAVAQQTLDYVLRDLRGPHGAFLAAEDAASPRGNEPRAEGAFYQWTADELRHALDEDAPLFAARYGVRPEGNAPLDPDGAFAGRNILYEAQPLAVVAQQAGLTERLAAERLAAARQRLLDVRAERPRPAVDDKVLVAWNGLMLSALAKGYQALGDERYRGAAEEAAHFLYGTLYDAATNTLHRRYRAGTAGLDAHLDDYAYLTQGLLDLYEAAPDYLWLAWAEALGAAMVRDFHDAERGGFYDAPESTTVPVRLQNPYDGDLPAPNAVAALSLARLAEMTGRPAWEAIAEGTVRRFAEQVREAPEHAPTLLAAHGFLQAKPKQVVIAGTPGAADTERMLAATHAAFVPHKIVLLADGGAAQDELALRLPFLETAKPRGGRATAYVCEDFVCRAPTTDPAEVARLLIGE